ncbi:glutathionylspermidine synthase family protein [Paenibacillus sp. FSL H7-0331]|uniref:glutathionylspermidine synthase family protein n=1 Tax=Paenibacillus sp. FSL H7-0331 TaxID=1920421 RepID=UPI00096E0B43|nr:glutathionylspermidine synthase family protein [Paenibacillus sp. FSL H7-0331]OMF19076.1 glutathionylspermidine synthase [Paenibacillus sp. FSL H7-0331]
MNYEELRNSIYNPLREEGIFTWDFMYESEYALADIHLITSVEHEQLQEATDRLARIFHKCYPVLQEAEDDFLLAMGIPAEALQTVRIKLPAAFATVYGALDLAWTTDGIKLIEFNADTPSLIVEAYYVNGHVCRHHGVINPNEGCEQHFPLAFQRMLEGYGELAYSTEPIAFCSLDWHEEDAATTRYLLQQSGLNGRFVPLSDLRVYEDNLYFVDGDYLTPVPMMLRHHALEKLAIETDEDGYPTGAHTLDLIARGKVGIINPPSAFLCQTKALLALIWSLHETGVFFSEEEHEWVARYMLPTYFENRFIGEHAYVEKPIYGREGGSVTLYDADGTIAEHNDSDEYCDQPMVYQKRVELPQITVQTLNGPYTGSALWRSFIIGGTPSAVLLRLGNKITGNESFYLPVGLKD